MNNQLLRKNLVLRESLQYTKTWLETNLRLQTFSTELASQAQEVLANVNNSINYNGGLSNIQEESMWDTAIQALKIIRDESSNLSSVDVARMALSTLEDLANRIQPPNTP